MYNIFFKSMAAGQTGEPGAVAVQLVVEEPKHEHVLVPILLLAVEALIVKEPARSLSRATVTHAQVRVVIRDASMLYLKFTMTRHLTQIRSPARQCINV